MFIETPKKGYFFDEEGIAKIEKMYGGKYMGPWSIKTKNGNWGETPVDVFYQPNPDTSKGHSHYFGMFRRGEEVYITNAESAFSEKITGVVCADGEVLVSRYRHDFVQKKCKMVDGGRDYIRSYGGPFVDVTVNGSEFVLSLIEDLHTQGWENKNDDGQMEFDFNVQV